MKIFLSIVVLVVFGHNVAAQHSIRLNNNWEFIKQDLGGIWEAVRPVTAGSPESVPVWSMVTLPHCFNSRDAVDPDGNYYQGPGWYRTQLDVNNAYQNGHTLLHFDGAGQKTDVYIYTTKVGSHLGGYDEWTVDISKAVEDFKQTEVCKKQFNGKVPLIIRCDNSRDLESIPSRLSDFCIYGGLYRYLNLVYVPALSIDKVFASATVDEQGKKGHLTAKIRFYNPDKITSATVNLKVFGPDNKVSIDTSVLLKNLDGDIPIGSFNILSPELWSAKSPKLYTVETLVSYNNITEAKVEKIGFRNFEFVDNGPFKLNGQRVLLKGTHRHDDQAGVASAVTEDMMRKEMQLIKDMGANFIRLGHYQQSPIILNLCDSLGLMVWEEEPWCRGGLGGDTYKNQARSMLTNMIEQHYNHPAVIIWGLGNENDWEGDFSVFDKQKIRAFMQEQNDRAHRLDPSRKTAIRRCDFCKDIVDVYSPSIWAGWYRGIYKDYEAVTEKEFKKVKHFLHIEWGGDSQALRYDENPESFLTRVRGGADADERLGDASLKGGDARVSSEGDWSESYICDLFDWTLKEQETMPWLTGSAFWTFKDFATPVRPDNPIPFMNQKGVVEHDLTKKESYYVFQSYWAEKPMVHIFGHNWPVRWGNAGELKTIKVYSNCNDAELIVNGKSYGTKRRDSQDFPAAGLRWMVPLKIGNNHIKVIAQKGTTKVIDELDQRYQTEKWGKSAKLAIVKTNEKNGLTTVEVKILDANNRWCLDSKNQILFSLAGDGKLIDDLGTSRGSRRVQAYNGRAIISVKTNGGKSIVGVQSPGLKSEFITL